MELDLKHFKQRLDQERTRLESELNELGTRNPQDPSDWTTKPEADGSISFRDEVADRLEDQDEKKQLELSLEAELKEVMLALSKFDDHSYGRCEVDQGLIELDRLEANPAARTCKNHLDQI